MKTTEHKIKKVTDAEKHLKCGACNKPVHVGELGAIKDGKIYHDSLSCLLQLDDEPKPDATKVSKRLQDLIPELEFAKETHNQWAHCDQKYRDENPSIGSAEFHKKYIKIYSERIAAINEAITLINNL